MLLVQKSVRPPPTPISQEELESMYSFLPGICSVNGVALNCLFVVDSSVHSGQLQLYWAREPGPREGRWPAHHTTRIQVFWPFLQHWNYLECSDLPPPVSLLSPSPSSPPFSLSLFHVPLSSSLWIRLDSLDFTNKEMETPLEEFAPATEQPGGRATGWCSVHPLEPLKVCVEPHLHAYCVLHWLLHVVSLGRPSSGNFFCHWNDRLGPRPQRGRAHSCFCWTECFSFSFELLQQGL